jgi:hypothetical protein
MPLGKRQPTGFRGVERDGGVRYQTELWRELPYHEPGCECRVANVCTPGALLAISSFGLPEVFVLRTPDRSYSLQTGRRGVGHMTGRIYLTAGFRHCCRPGIARLQSMPFVLRGQAVCCALEELDGSEALLST